MYLDKLEKLRLAEPDNFIGGQAEQTDMNVLKLAKDWNHFTLFSHLSTIQPD